MFEYFGSLCYVTFGGENTGLGNSLHVELSGAMRPIEIANSHQRSKLWLEADSELVIKTLNNVSLVPWKLRNRWLNCVQLISRINFWPGTSLVPLKVISSAHCVLYIFQCE